MDQGLLFASPERETLIIAFLKHAETRGQNGIRVPGK
jgi:hypothetical protein